MVEPLACIECGELLKNEDKACPHCLTQYPYGVKCLGCFQVLKQSEAIQYDAGKTGSIKYFHPYCYQKVAQLHNTDLKNFSEVAMNVGGTAASKKWFSGWKRPSKHLKQQELQGSKNGQYTWFIFLKKILLYFGIGAFTCLFIVAAAFILGGELLAMVFLDNISLILGLAIVSLITIDLVRTQLK